MGDRTKIDWADATWNPVTGCLHGCPYCYARRIAERFGSGIVSGTRLHELDEPVREYIGNERYSAEPYPYDFDPTLHRYRLGEPQKWKKPRNIFVCSMADLFGDWVPDDWKIEVLKACAKAPQHRYLFLTKYPVGYAIWPTEEIPCADETRLFTKNMWIGVTWTGTERIPGEKHRPNAWGHDLGTGSNFWYLWRMSRVILPGMAHRFLSIEPMACDVSEVRNERDPDGEALLETFVTRGPSPMDAPPVFEWVIVGAETGNRKGKVKPERKWIEKLARLCRENGIPLFMKESIRGIMGENFVQEFPWEAER